MIKKKIIYSLVIFAVVLLLINIVVEAVSEPEVVVINNDIPGSEIEKIFMSSLWQHGILDEWISAKTINNPGYDSLSQVYYIEIPGDLQVVNLISSLSESFADIPVKLITEERVNYSNSTVKVYSNGVLKLEAFVNQSDEIKREYSEITFIVRPGQLLNEESKSKLKSIRIDYSLLLTPSTELSEILDDYSRLIPSIVLLISNEMDDEKYELDPDMEKLELKRNIINLISDFSRTRRYFIDERTEIYSSIAYPYVKSEFSQRNIEIERLSQFVDLRGKPFEQVKSIFKFHCDNGKGKQRRFLLVALHDFINLQPDIKKYKKLGNKFFALQ